MYSRNPVKLVTLRGECFEVEFQRQAELPPATLRHFHVTDLGKKKGMRLVSILSDWTLQVQIPHHDAVFESVCLNTIRRAVDAGALSFDSQFDRQHYQQLSLEASDFQVASARTDPEIRQYIIHKAYWLAFRFPIHAQSTGIMFPIPFDEPDDLAYLGITEMDVARNVQRLANQGLLEKVLEGHARPTELLLSRYESEGRSGLGLQNTGSASSLGPGGSDDRRFADLAIEEARKSVPEDARVHPRVGVVVVKDGHVLATAHRGEIPQCHAEYIALEKKLQDVSLVGATVYTTLEPCTSRNHPKVPCATRLTERKVSRVVIGMLDPDDRISGRGQRTLRRAGIATELFPHDLMAEAEELNRDFLRDREGMEGAPSDTNTTRASKSLDPAVIATPPSQEMRNAVAYAFYETKGENAKRAKVFVFRSSVNKDLFRFQNSHDDELHGPREHEGPLEEISVRFVTADAQLRMKGYVRMNHGNPSGIPGFEL